LDILPGRDGEALRVWLQEHPTVTVITRDRWAAFAQAAADGAPQAKQVADRWHLLKNLREAVERLLARLSGQVQEALAEDHQTPVVAATTTSAASQRAEVLPADKPQAAGVADTPPANDALPAPVETQPEPQRSMRSRRQEA